MQITFNKITNPNQIFSIWEVLSNGQETKYRVVGEQHPRFKNIYSIWNTETNNCKTIGSLESAKAWIANYLTKGN